MAQLVPSLLLAGGWTGVGELLGQDPVVALDFAVVPRRVGARALVAATRSRTASLKTVEQWADPLSVTRRVMRPIPLASKKARARAKNAIAVAARSSSRASAGARRENPSIMERGYVYPTRRPPRLEALAASVPRP